MEPELKKLFELRKQESDLISVGSNSYGRISLLLAQAHRHTNQPIVLDAIGQRLDNFRAGLTKIAEGYRQVYHTTSKDDIRTVAKTLEKSTLDYLAYIETSFA